MSAVRSSTRAALAALIAVAVLGASACSSAPALSDPTEILTKAIEALQNAKTVHLAATVDGQFSMNLTGSGNGGSVSLAGTKLEGDFDVAGKKAKVTFQVPAILGLTGEVITAGDATYLKTNLGGDKYSKTTGGTGALPVDPANPDAAIAEIKTFLKKPEVSPTKGDDVDCGGKKCYSISIELTAAEIGTLSSPDPAPSLDPSTSVKLTILVEKDSVRFSTITAVIAAGTEGSLTVDLAFSKWDESVTIEAPPADQVTAG